ncbi:MAG: hypothetical protein IT370_11895 [Deltaproteobacteria bacterium]|nr:hypothetical protein [Deltaproteobacteria bacterium]
MRLRNLRAAAILVAVVAASAGAVIAGCALFDECADISCFPCPPSRIEVSETDTGAPVTEVTVTDDTSGAILGTGCNGDSDAGTCTVNLYLHSGAHNLRVSAKDHGTVIQRVTVPPGGDGCCTCSFIQTPVPVRLPRL